MDFFDSLATIGRGAIESAARHQLKNDPKLRKKAKKAAQEQAERCTPCAAAGWMQQQRDVFGLKR